jgi:transposase
MSGKAAKVQITEKQKALLEEFVAARSTLSGLQTRCHIILLAHEGHNNETIEQMVGLGHDAVGRWRRRWRDNWPRLISIECGEGTAALKKAITELLSDIKRSGRPPRITAVQQAELAAKACEDPQDSGRPISQWSSDELADEMSQIPNGFAISGGWVRRLLARMDIRPHHHQYWLFSKDKTKDPMFDWKVTAICNAYSEAIDLYHRQGVHTICVDEMTGIQALERIAQDLPVRAGSVARLEYEYKRHGTTGLFGNLHVATGKIWSPLLRQTRGEIDMLENINNLICEGGEDASYRFIMDNLNTHCSETMVQMIAGIIGYTEDLGVKGKSGILQSTASRREFLSDPTHRIQFIFTPRHCSWLNQVEIWFGTLRRKLLRRMSFTSTDHVEEMIIAFIEYYNKTLAKPYQWTYRGTVLAAW